MFNAKRDFDFKDILVDFPKPGELAIFWAEPIELDLSAPYFGWGPVPWDYMDLHMTMGGNLGDHLPWYLSLSISRAKKRDYPPV